MNYIPIVVDYRPDELLLSWIYRLSQANGIPFEIFCKIYLEKKDAEINGISVDVISEFMALYSHLYYKDNLKKMYIQLTTYKFESVFMRLGDQTRYINRVFRKKSKLNTSLIKLFNQIKICPLCLEEDIELYKSPYIHRSHQLAGVCTCYKHNCKLMYYKGKSEKCCEFNLEQYTDMEIVLSKAHIIVAQLSRQKSKVFIMN